MPAVYYKNRQEAGQKAIEAFAPFRSEQLTIVSLDADGLVIGAQLSQAFGCPLQLYIAGTVEVPGGVSLGSVNTEGGFSYNSNMAAAETDYFYQEFHGYIEEAKRTAFSNLNRQLGSKEVLRKDLLKKHSIVVVTDCLVDQSPLDSFIAYLKPIPYQKLYVCAPIVKTQIISHLREVSDFVYFDGDVEFFYGKDHYFEDNSTYSQSDGINLVSSYLQLWPQTA